MWMGPRVCVRVMKKRAITESHVFSRLQSAAKPQGEPAIDFHRLLTEMKDNKNNNSDDHTAAHVCI